MKATFIGGPADHRVADLIRTPSRVLAGGRHTYERIDDPNPARTLIDGAGHIAVTAVEDTEHYRDRAPGPTYTNGERA